jgi:hypothetical protein
VTTAVAPEEHRATAWQATARPRREHVAAHLHGTAATPGHPHNCTCLDCCDRAAAWHRRKRRHTVYGTWQPFVPVGPVLAHIDELSAAGMADRQIVKAAGTTLAELYKMRHGRQRVRPGTAARYLAVRLDLHALDPKAFLPARGAQRRLQALRAIGWPNPQLVARSGLSLDTMSRILRSRYVWASTMLRIQELYEDLRDQDPAAHGVAAWVAHRSISYAQARHWAVPLAWTDIDADDQPNRQITRLGYRAIPQVRSAAEVVTETRALSAGGATREQIVQRLGMEWNSIAVAHKRADELLPLALRGDP